MTLSRTRIFAGIAGAWVAEVNVSDQDKTAYNFTVSDARFVVSGRSLYLQPGVSIDRSAEAEINLQITVTDPAAQTSLTRAFLLTVDENPGSWPFAHQWLLRPFDVD
jgi:hypothetical protein